MRVFACLLLAVLLLAAAPAWAQNGPKFEVFAGYSYARANSTVVEQGTNGNGGGDDGVSAGMRVGRWEPQFGLPAGTRINVKSNLNGWNFSLAGNVSRWFGFVADFGGHYGTPEISGVQINTHVYSFLFGPRISIRKYERVTPFVHALFGTAHARGEVLGVSDTDRGFAMAVGGGLDVKLSKIVFVRVVQADYYRTNLFDEGQNNFRYSAGVVLRFGK